MGYWPEDGNEGIDNKAGAQYNNESATKGQKGGNSMRKIFALVLALTLLAVPLYAAVATGVDLRDMTNEELTTLKKQLDAEMLDRGMVISAALPIGTYTVGIDILKGDYEFRQENRSNYSACLIFGSEQELQANNHIEAHGLRDDDVVKVSLMDGLLLKIEGGAMKITSFGGIQWQ